MDGGELAAQEAFMRDQGHEIAFFVERFVRAYSTPPILESEGARTGGVAIGAWSYGNIYHTALLAHVSSLPDETRALLERHLRTIVYLGMRHDSRLSCITRLTHSHSDASSPSVGVPTAEGVYHPLRDTALSPEERGEVFLPWVSTYFTTVSSLSEVSPGLLAARAAVSEDVATPTVKRMTQSELASITHFNALTSNLALRQIDRSVYAANLRLALVDTGGAFPGVKVLVLWADMSIGDCVWAAKGIAGLVAADFGEEKSDVRREVQFVKLEESNHFVRPVPISLTLHSSPCS